ncbi:MAG TPA: AsmA-like C-terminal region-containing protein [Candidatus Babeliales bacterium]|nr:AsmA-like C-terminal region-containing protein [Candidatus Babeliales bacterium]
MQKLRRLALIALGALIGLGAVGLLGVNLYVQSQGAQGKIQQELSRSLGVPLKIRSMSVTPWGGLELSGITIPQAASAGAKDFLEARTFRLRVRFLSLFSRRLVIKEVSLVDPKVVWPQNTEGKWRLPDTRVARPQTVSINQTPPTPQTEPGPALVQTNTAPAVTSEASVPSTPKTAVKDEPPRREPKLAVAPEVRRVSVKNGDFTFLDQNERLVASFAGVNFRTNIRSAQALRGDAKVARVSLRNRFFLEQLRSPIRYEPDVLELSKISARVAEGEVDGYFAIQPEAEDSPFTTNIKFHDVLADQLVANAGGAKGMVKGKLEGSFQASGKTSDPEALVGQGEISLRDGRVQQYRLLVLLGQILQIEELQELHLEQADAKYHLRPGVVTIDELVLRSPNIRLTSSGTVAFDGALQLNSQLAINDRVRGQLFKAIRDNFHRIEDPGYSAIEFQVGGTIERPSTNLVEQVVGRDISSMLNSFFGGKKDRPKKKKKALEDAAPATPEPSDAGRAMTAAPFPSLPPTAAIPEATATPSPVASP